MVFVQKPWLCPGLQKDIYIYFFFFSFCDTSSWPIHLVVFIIQNNIYARYINVYLCVFNTFVQYWQRLGSNIDIGYDSFHTQFVKEHDLENGIFGPPPTCNSETERNGDFWSKRVFLKLFK